ncbi:haloacid dehalogenase type II [Paraburkholderia sp. BR10937]|uniref:haloacid dehalogenase type II n=1 Tax=Paraburkholderia sp. BR10937 TaxID=3236994 RepID=UPI0034D36EF6
MLLKALTFDIIGTVFDAYDGLAQGVALLNARYGVSVNGAAFASGSLNGYSQGVAQVLSSGMWVPPDMILQTATRENLPIAQLGTKADAAVQDYFDLWHALPPWPDVAAGMAALHSRYTLAVLSNMSVTTQSALRAHASLPFDRLLSAETVQHYKPDHAVYQMAISSLGVDASEILMVAAHNFDLNAARAQGFRTAFVGRPAEFGPGGSPGNHPDPSLDFNATSLIDLAEQLGAWLVTPPDDCLPLRPDAVQVQNISGDWKIVDGNQQVLDFGRSQANAVRAKAIIEHYRFDRICFVGRPDPPMMYFTIGGEAPSGAMPGEDAIPFDLAGVVTQQVAGSWIVTDGASRMLDFGTSEAKAVHSVSMIKRYGFTHQCFVGRPNAPMMYFRK